MLRALTESGKGRTAAKLRSYLRQAYALAARAALKILDAPATAFPARSMFRATLHRRLPRYHSPETAHWNGP